MKRPLYPAAGFALLLIILASLFLYKWGGSLATLEAVRASGRWTRGAEGLTSATVFRATLNYFQIIWPALVFGLLIGAAVRAFISPRWVINLFGERPLRQQLLGAAAGTPLMLCSCCITAVFTGVYERGLRLGPSLAVMLASPGLNPAALVLTFLLLPAPLGFARLSLTLLAVLPLAALVGRAFDSEHLRLLPRVSGELACNAAPEAYSSWRDLAGRFARSLGYLTLVTLPLIALGAFLSGLILPRTLASPGPMSIVTLTLLTAGSVLVALPTFFEIPLALFLTQLGAPPGAALAILFAGPIINLPSLLVLGRQTRPQVAGALALGIWLLALAGAITLW